MLSVVKNGPGKNIKTIGATTGVYFGLRHFIFRVYSLVGVILWPVTSAFVSFLCAVATSTLLHD